MIINIFWNLNYCRELLSPTSLRSSPSTSPTSTADLTSAEIWFGSFINSIVARDVIKSKLTWYPHYLWQVRKAYDMDEDDETGRENFRIKATSQLYLPNICHLYVTYYIVFLICYLYQNIIIMILKVVAINALWVKLCWKVVIGGFAKMISSGPIFFNLIYFRQNIWRLSSVQFHFWFMLGD